MPLLFMRGVCQSIEKRFIKRKRVQKHRNCALAKINTVWASYIHYGDRIQSEKQHMIALIVVELKESILASKDHCNALLILLFCRSSLVRNPREVFLTSSSSSSSPSSSLCSRTLAHGISIPS